MSDCENEHRYWEIFNVLPQDQGGFGRHKCCGCAYENGYAAGLNREENLHINLEAFKTSQAGTVRHKSPHAAFALGYLNGIRDSYLD